MIQKPVYFAVLLVIMMIGGFVVPAGAEAPDTTKSYQIKEIIVSERYRNTDIRSTNGVQTMQREHLQSMPGLLLSDAVKYFSGVNLKDFGGIGGLKTISVRSLGANHTAVSLDGITVNDVQTGQIDLSQFSLEMLETTGISQGQADQLFQPARNFASGSLLQLQTHFPDFRFKQKITGKVSLKAGSFGLVNPSGYLFYKINNRWQVGLTGEMLVSRGDYPYVMTYGADSSTVERRTNSDVQTFKGELRLKGQLSEKENLTVLSSLRSTERGLPGATIFYNSQHYAHQRLSEQSFFTQAHYQNRIAENWSVQSHLKYNHGYLRYQDPDFMDSSGGLDNSYEQDEYYLSGSVLFVPTDEWTFSASSDVFYQDMQANISGFVSPARWSYLQSVQARYSTEQMQASAGYVGTFVWDESDQSRKFTHGSPYLGLSYYPLKNKDLHIRMFYKDVFRLPTFNDMYYPMVGSRDLNPEKARQLNIGLTFPIQWQDDFNFTFTADGYKNWVTDKIVTFPNKNTFNWTVMNFGQVEITGLDLTGEVNYVLSDKISLVAQAGYTYQKSLDVTEPGGRTWLHQLPYTPRISGSGRITLVNPLVNIAYGLLWSGHRYALIENYAENRLPGYAEHNVSFVKDIRSGDQLLQCKFEVLNLWNENYQIVRWFSMPGRNFRIGATYSF